MMDDRDQRRAYRRQRRYGGYYGRMSGLIWPVAILLFIFTHSWIWFPLAIFAPMILSAIFGSLNQGPMQQQPYYQPTEQPAQPVYQQPYQSEAEQPPVYQPYTQGYTPQQPVHEQPEVYQEGEQQHQYPVQQQPVQQHQQQYEDPMVMYPQE